MTDPAQPAPADLRAALEGTWRFEEWHVDGQVQRPPQVDGWWSNHDGVVLFVIHRTIGDVADSTVGYGEYVMDARTWGYRYTRMETSAGPVGGPRQVTVTTPPDRMAMFDVRREDGKVVLEGVGGDRREYEEPFFTFMPGGRIVRRWRRVG